MAGSPTIEVVLIEDHTMVRDGLRALLEPVEDIVVVGEAGDVAAIEHLTTGPHVAVTDLVLPDGAESVVVDAVRRHLPDTAILVLSMVDDLDAVESVLRAGASGYVLKDAASTELIQAIRIVATQGAYLQPVLGVALARRRREDDTGLTPRERDVLRLIALGHTNGEIADLLRVSLRTIETTRAAVSEKIGAGSRAQLVRYALERGLLGAGGRA